MDTVLYGGTIHLVDTQFRTVTAIAVADGRIVATGTDDEILASAPASCAKINLDGATVVPGFIDDHVHLALEIETFGRIDLRDVTSLPDLLSLIRDSAQAKRPGQWVAAVPFWHEKQLTERRLPTREELDVVCPNNPAFVPRGSQRGVINTRAIELLGFSSDGPQGLMRDAHGQPTGLITGPAHRAVLTALGSPGFNERVTAIQSAMKRYNALGITSIREGSTTPADARLFQYLSEQDLMTVRVAMLMAAQPLAAETMTSAEHTIASLRRIPVRTGFGDNWLRFSGLKMLIDGALEGAYLYEPYLTDPDYRGDLRLPGGLLDSILPEIADLGWSLAMHVSGDASMDVFLDAVERLSHTHDIRPLRWSVEHAFFASPEQCARLKQLGLLVTIQMALLYDYADAMVTNWGSNRVQLMCPVRSMIEAGLLTGGGSDGPFVSISPLVGMQTLVTRNTLYAGTVGPEQAVDARTALAMYTRDNAHFTFEEQVKGTLEPRKVADLTVLGRDPLDCPPDELGQIPVLLTMVDGRIVHDAY